MASTKKQLVNEKSTCSFDQINSEINTISESSNFLDSIFHLNKKEIDFFSKRKPNEINIELKETIMLKFMARLNDLSKIDTECIPPKLTNITISDISLYCLAKIEPIPFALATGGQNCTEPWISSEISLPINFIHFFPTERERITYRYLKYFYSKERSEFVNSIKTD